jgi:hypothetical protein
MFHMEQRAYPAASPPQGRLAARSDAIFRSHERGFRSADALLKIKD